MINRETIERPGGEEWHQYNLDNGLVLTTGAWRALVSEQEGIHEQVNMYRRQLASAYAGSVTVAETLNQLGRTYIAEGRDGTVYAVGDHMVAKERKPWSSKSFLEYFERMENLRSIVQQYLPHWVDTPNNYGLYVSDDYAHQHLLMQRISRGVTLEDLHKPDKAAPFKHEQLHRLLSGLGSIGLQALDDQLGAVHMSLVDVLRTTGHRYDDYVRDWGPHNVIIEGLQHPIGDSRYKFWIIDQQ